ncbi:STAS domain-containing protein [Actinospica sp. MGRD01-02]|uniref:Anti-sigma factor antagonist n=1 Tax=Actinospica acidithermotolerans TaxID=2828514 RepID=A0A941E5X2_9ACTN|nr:STAS domain-containing protein [Actinospica acidithermotolerans]MBR7825017.1 STAS domain-containing protein [Actinospica acidithermotolerans]
MDGNQPFAVTVSHPREGRAVLSIRGDLDLASAQALREPLAESLSRNSLVVIEMGACGFMDSSGLRVLLAAAQRAGQAGGALRLVEVGPEVERVIEMTGLLETLPIFADVDAALAE